MALRDVLKLSIVRGGRQAEDFPRRNERRPEGMSQRGVTIESIRKSPNKLCRANLDVADMVAHRSDIQPGMYRCIECGKGISLQESWRENNELGTTGTLFCYICAQKVNRLGAGAITLQPFSPSRIDQINLGIYQQGLSEAAPAAPIATMTAAERLNKYGI